MKAKKKAVQAKKQTQLTSGDLDGSFLQNLGQMLTDVAIRSAEHLVALEAKRRVRARKS